MCERERESVCACVFDLSKAVQQVGHGVPVLLADLGQVGGQVLGAMGGVLVTTIW